MLHRVLRTCSRVQTRRTCVLLSPSEAAVFRARLRCDTTSMAADKLSVASAGYGARDAARSEVGSAVSGDFDRAQFDVVFTVPAIKVPPRSLSTLIKALQGSLLEVPKIRTVVSIPGDDSHKLARLSTRFSSVAAADVLGKLSPQQQQAIADAGGELTTDEVTMGYDNLGVDEILRRLLPSSIRDVPSSFELVGRIAHVNLRDEQLPYRYLIGQVLLDKNPNLRTVVNKVGVIESQFRTFPMEVIAGEADTTAEVKHCGATFRFDFKDVYWNSRLQGEHEHMVETLPRGSIVADMFCGVGPFAVPLGLPNRACTVYANDLNPKSHAALVENVRRNKVGGRVKCYNLDARDFIAQLVAEGVPFQYALMNLPLDAISFLDAFLGVYNTHPEATTNSAAITMPKVHVYCFTRGGSPYDARIDVTKRILQALRLLPQDATPAALTGTLSYEGDSALCAAVEAAKEVYFPDLVVREVRDVAPNKLMMCGEFVLPRAAAFATGRKGGGSAATVPPDPVEEGCAGGGGSVAAVLPTEDDVAVAPPSKRARVDSATPAE